MRGSPSTVSAIVPLHGDAGHLAQFWPSLLRARPDSCQIILVDDGSNLDFSTSFPGIDCVDNVVIVRHDRPKGFAAAVNSGIFASQGDGILLLNSDLILNENCLREMLRVTFESHDVGVVSATLLYPQSGCVQHAGLLFTETNHYHVFQNLPGDHPLVSESRDVESAAFALVSIRRNVVETVGFLNEAYFNGYEDLDYCFRIRERGLRIHVAAEARAYHWEKQSGPRRSIWRKDNVARLWRDWGTSIKPDISRFHAESWNSLLLAAPHLSSVEFCRIELFGVPSQQPTLVDVHGRGPRVSETWDYRQPSAADYWLPYILPVSAVQHEQPFIYVVENISDLAENHYWFALRRTYSDADLIADYCGNIVEVPSGRA